MHCSTYCRSLWSGRSLQALHRVLSRSDRLSCSVWWSGYGRLSSLMLIEFIGLSLYPPLFGGNNKTTSFLGRLDSFSGLDRVDSSFIVISPADIPDNKH